MPTASGLGVITVAKRQNMLFGIFGITGLAATFAASHRLGITADDYKFFDELIEVKHAITTKYVESPDESALREGAIKGMVEALNDPYTVYVPASDKREFNKSLTGEYVGIGSSVNVIDGWLTIISPLEDSPSFRAGLMADDRVVAIDGKSTQNLSVDACIDLLMGEPKTPVVLTIERKGVRQEITVVRDRIKTRSVKGFHRSAADPNAWDFMIDPVRRIGYIRLTQFTPKCAAEVEQALVSMGADGGKLNGLVLDLRWNPGGLLSEAEAIADLFLEKGVIVSTRGRAYAEKITRAKPEGTLPDFPIAVLINGASASASEVLSGALAENNRAIIVGTRSFGKGSVQSVIELPSGRGSELKITEQGYYLPSGRSITRKDDSPTWGVDPSDGFYVPMTDEETVAMLEVRRREEVLRHSQESGETAADNQPVVNWSEGDSILAALKDKQLAAAVRAVALKVDTGSWEAVGEKEAQAGRIAGAELFRANQYRERLLRELARNEKRIDALESAAGGSEPTAPDLWTNEVDLSGGVMEIRDKDGNVVAVLDITGNNLERYLFDADVKKRNQSPPPAKPADGVK
ncbi:MAG: S41 family peptidase [Phycisphaerae bacterium]|nr:S41 family peptidase [Phycisphaerae bacterium]